MTETTKWHPTPPENYNSDQRKDYFAGYSDAFYGYKHGSGHDNPTVAYRLGYHDGHLTKDNNR